MGRKRNSRRTIDDRDSRGRRSIAAGAGKRPGTARGSAREKSGFSLGIAQIQRHWRVLAVCGLLVLAVGLVFAQTAGFRLVNYDDDKYIRGPVVNALTAKTVSWAFAEPHQNNWTPLAWLSHALDSQVYGAWPGGRHLTNVLLHAAAVVGLFLVLRAMTGGTGSASGTLWPGAGRGAVCSSSVARNRWPG